MISLLREGARVRAAGADRGRLAIVTRVAWAGRVSGASPGTPGALGVPIVVTRSSPNAAPVLRGRQLDLFEFEP